MPDAEVQIAHRGFEIGAIGHFVRDDAELLADRVGHFSPDHRDCDGHRMAGAQRSDDYVDGIRKLRTKLFLAAVAQEPQHQGGSATPPKRAATVACVSVPWKMISREYRDQPSRMRAPGGRDRWKALTAAAD